MPPRTLTFRLVATSLAWVAASLLAAGILLVLLFRDHIERRFDQELFDHLEELIAASEISPEGALMLTWTPSDPRFNRPQSGWYWQIAAEGAPAVRSDSLWRDRLAVAPPTAGAGPQIQHLRGPGDESLRALVQDITLPDAAPHFTFTVAGPVSDVQRDVNRFTAQLAATLGLLGLGLVAAVVFQVRFGLGPLRGLQHALAEIRAGRAGQLPQTFPDEVEPVVEELNALLEHNAATLQRARTQAGNLAHAIKNPLTVIRNETQAIRGEHGALLRDQVTAVTDCIDRYLSRARAAGAAGVLGARASVAEIVEDLRFSMARLYAERGLEIRASVPHGLCFRGDAHDLEEMAGNILDNACKWARSRVTIAAQRRGERLLIEIEDDGPGIPEDRRTEAQRRSSRLDEAAPGSGLGLSIVREIAELYHGGLELGTSRLGGARAKLDLPAAD